MPADRIPNYTVSFLNPDGTTNLIWWHFLASIAGQFSGVDMPLPGPRTWVCTQATFPALARLSERFIYVSDFAHTIYWDGLTTPVFADGGSDYYVTASAAPAAIGWHAADGSTQKFLNADGTLTARTLTATADSWFRL
jgi:hypothetical protein